MKVYIALYLSRGEWVPLGDIPHAFVAEENAWKALEIAFGYDPFKQVVICMDGRQYEEGLKGWLKKD